MTLPGALGGRVCGMWEEHESLGARGQTGVVSPQDGLQEHLPPGIRTFCSLHPHGARTGLCDVENMTRDGVSLTRC